ncbi:HtaA domain-containing protein [Streptomyces sp. NBC_00525]|uniref:HtaA domain-containing protein n=1 Tax=Streptomyces sp. NBC_00525 TaxID=2903660 RepID=UPI002E808BE3|nr:HtaA domain-containing protein [Streptomyces sp. NBC_00525]WUC93403.1 HtaA domain-containing protein [Streptomyces sp. NBC_00525]
MAATRRPLTLAAAVATAATLGAALALPALAADRSDGSAGAGARVIDLKDGTLDWGFKESFRRYVGGAGKITVSDGATQAANNGVFTFVNGKGTYDTATYGTATAFEGGVNFSAHGGVLDITLSDVKVTTTGKGGAITADVATPQGTTDDVAVAELDLSAVKPGQGAGGAMVFKDIPAKLTKAGSEAFNGQYKEGEALDPATLTVTAAPAPSEKPTEKPTEPTEPSEKPTEKPSEKPTEPTGKPTATPTKPTTAPSPTATATGTGGPAATTGAIVDGALNWGVKESFRSYVTGPIAHGRAETTGGAKAAAGGYRFTDATGTFDAAGQTLKATFGGKVRFLGHQENGSYTLDLSFSRLTVRVNGGKGTLLADVSAKDRATKKVSTYTALPLADLKLPAGKLTAKDGVVTLSGVPATLTAEGGTKAFGGMYKAGDQLDPLTVAVSLDKNATLPSGTTTGGSTTGGSTTSGGGSGSVGGAGSVGGVGGAGTVGGSGALAATGSDVPTGPLLAASGLVVAAGAGAVLVARRRRTA